MITSSFLFHRLSQVHVGKSISDIIVNFYDENLVKINVDIDKYNLQKGEKRKRNNLLVVSKGDGSRTCIFCFSNR